MHSTLNGQQEQGTAEPGTVGSCTVSTQLLEHLNSRKFYKNILARDEEALWHEAVRYKESIENCKRQLRQRPVGNKGEA